MPELQIPFITGQHEELDARVAPDGTLHAVKELVTKRQGRWEKRKEFVELTNTVAGIPAVAGEIWSLNQHHSDRLIAYGQPPRLAVHSTELDAITATAQLGLPAFSAPQRYPVPHELGDDNAEVVQTDIVYINGWTVVLWVIGTTARVGWYEEATRTLIAVSVGYTITTTTAKLCKAGNYVVLAYPTSSTEISARVWLSTSTAQPAFGSATVIASGLVAAGSGFALSEFRGTSNFLLAAITQQTTTTEADLYVYNPASLGSPVNSALNVVVFNQTGDAFLAIDGNSSEGVLLAWRYSGAANGMAYMHRNDDLTSNLGSTAIVTNSNLRKAPSLLQLNSTTWMLASDDLDTGSAPYDVGSVEVWQLTTGGSTTGPTNHYDVRPVSQLFGFTDSAGLVRPYIVVVCDRDTNSTGGTPFTQSYYLLALSTASFANHVDSLRPQGFFGRDVGVSLAYAYNQLPKVVTTADGFAFAAPYIAQGTALDRNEFIEDYRLATGVWRWSATSRGDRLQAVTLGEAAYLSGGIMARWDGARATEAGFLRRPDITRLIPTSTGAMTGDATYWYLAVFESVTGDGEIVRSEPSTVAEVTLSSAGGEDAVTVKLRDNKLRANNPFATTPEQRIYLYRTLANQPGVYYMAHAQDDPIIGYGFGVTTEITYTDEASDATISDRPTIYSTADGAGLLPNVTPPPCRYLAVVGKRLVCGGLEVPEEVWVSAEKVTGEQVNFKDDPAFKATLPGPCTGIGELDGYPVLFTASSIHMLLGAGPDDTGSGLFELRQIPTDLGAISGHMVTTDEGLVYQSARGLELLPRGFGAPQWIGGPVADALGAATITSMVSVGDDVRCSFSGGVLVWNTTWNAWSVFALGAVCSAAVWGQLHVLGYEDWSETVPIALETDATPATYINGRIETKDLSIGSIAGYWRARELIGLFEYRGQARVTFDISYNSGQSWPDTLSFDLSSGTYSVGDVVPLSFTLPWQKSDRFRFRISDSGYNGTSTGTDGVRYLGMTLDFEKKPGLKRLREGLRG